MAYTVPEIMSHLNDAASKLTHSAYNTPGSYEEGKEDGIRFALSLLATNCQMPTMVIPKGAKGIEICTGI